MLRHVVCRVSRPVAVASSAVRCTAIRSVSSLARMTARPVTAAAAAIGKPKATAAAAAVAPRKPLIPAIAVRFFSAGHDDHHAHEMSSYLPRAEVVERVMLTLNTLDKLKREALTETAHFTKDLGLDSLDTVETVIALEEEFGAVFPDDVAEQIETVKDVIEVLCTTPNLASIHAVH